MNSFSYRLQKTSLFVPDAEMYAKNAVNTLGVVDHSTGYWAHGIQVSLIIISNLKIITGYAYNRQCRETKNNRI